MAQTFYWYDLETSGTDPRWDRIVQFAGFRTDMNLNVVGDEYCTYVRLPDDVLPNPEATLVTGITPALTHREGISEFEALDHVRGLFSEPGTCGVGYNSLRFDDEFIRHGFYRLLFDPYAREWQNGNSRWDIIDLVRATGALRRDGITWPTNEEGLPSYRLEDMTRANGLDHGQAHDALSDVRATVSVARMIKTAQPRLFDFYLKQRPKKQVRKLLEPYGARLCLHVSGMYPREQFCSAPVISVCRHPTNSNSIIVADLSRDIEPLLTLGADELRERLFAPAASGIRADQRPPLKEIRVNRCPFVAGLEVLDDENWGRIGYRRRDAEKRQRRLRQPGIAQKIQRIYAGRQPDPAADPDAALYEGFLQDADRRRCEHFLDTVRSGGWVEPDFEDKRLHVMQARLKARSFPERLDPDERADFEAFVSAKLNAEQVPWLTLPTFRAALEARAAARDGETAASPQSTLLDELAAHADMLASRYPV